MKKFTWQNPKKNDDRTGKRKGRDSIENGFVIDVNPRTQNVQDVFTGSLNIVVLLLGPLDGLGLRQSYFLEPYCMHF